MNPGWQVSARSQHPGQLVALHDATFTQVPPEPSWAAHDWPAATQLSQASP